MVYYYDTTGICCFRHTIFSGGLNCETFYYYRKNLQGDVTAILDESGTVIAKYTYDAWGNCTITYDPYGIGVLNPIRYRSYYYDTETGLYYLKSRYYDPNTGRFINADVYVSTGQGILGNNMFAYCGNDPTNRRDSLGLFWKNLVSNFLQTVKIASGYFAVAAGVSQTDTPLPGPADVVSAVMLAAGLIVCAGIASYTTITAPVPAINTPNHAKKSKSLEDIAARHGIGECVEAAREMKIENGNKGNIIMLYFPNAYNGYVCCDRYPQVIGETGKHYGYLHDGVVRCNIYPEGLLCGVWITKFYDASGTPPIVTIF